MASTKNKIGLKFEGLEEMISKLESLEGDLKTTTEKALIASKQHVVEELRKVTVPANYPAGGKYSTGRTQQSIDTDMTVNWNGTTAEISVGYNMEISGMTSIFLMYGTPRHKPPMKAVRKMYNAIYGSKMKKEIAEIQREAFAAEVQRKMKG
jgi:hypothetical protein